MSMPVQKRRDADNGPEAESVARMRQEIDKWRREWRLVRDERISVKMRLAGIGLDIKAVRADRMHRELKKRQRYVSTRIKHIERRLNRRNAATRKRVSREG